MENRAALHRHLADPARLRRIAFAGLDLTALGYRVIESKPGEAALHIIIGRGRRSA